jgi:RNA polymerase-binding transcription factor DksA
MAGYCDNCGDILDTDRLAGNARPGDEFCDACCVQLRDEDEARWVADNTDTEAAVVAEMGAAR